MSVPLYFLIRPLVYLLAIIAFWETAKRELDARWRFAGILGGLFVISAAVSVYETGHPVEGVIGIGGRHVPFSVAKAVLENTGLFAIVGSLLMLLRKRLETARREVRQLARIASESADAIVGVNSDLQITSWNRGAEMAFGRLAEEMVGQNVERLVSSGDRQKLAQAAAHAAREGFVRGLSCRMHGRERRKILAEVTLSAVTDEDGRPAGVSLFIRDVTEQREMETELLHSSKMAAMGKLASGVVGEFGNLLTVISAKAQLGAAAESREEATEHFRAIESSVERAKSVTNNLLSYARRQLPRKTQGRISEAMNSALSLVSRELQEAGVDVVRRYGDVPETAFDRDQMVQVFLNLLLHAIQGLQRGGRIECEVEARREYIRACVRDDGPRIPAERLERLFEPFAAESGRIPDSQDTGLGLFVCREIVKYHSGSISVASDEGGTSVDVYLPIVSLPKSEQGGEVPVFARDGARVAVVDSDGMIRDLLSQLLRQKGFEPITFADAETAVHAGVGEGFALAFVDISIRCRDGQRYVEQLKSDGGPAVVAMVREAVGPDELARIEKGLAGLLRKPFGVDEVDALCRALTPETARSAASARRRSA